MKATRTTIASNFDDISTVSVSNAGDILMTSSSQKEEVLNTNSILPYKNPPEGKTTAIVAVMRGRPKHSHHHQGSNKHYKQILVWVLLDSGSDGRQTHAALLLKNAGSTVMEYFKWDVSDQV